METPGFISDVGPSELSAVLHCSCPTVSPRKNRDSLASYRHRAHYSAGGWVSTLTLPAY